MEIKKITVIGSGIMGNGIAQVAASYEYEVYLVDISKDALQNAMENIKKSLTRLQKKGKIDEKKIVEVMGRIKTTDNLNDGLSDTDYIIEAIIENKNEKISLLKKVDKIIPDHTIIASNTSQFSITGLGSNTNRPDKFIGMHFFNPPVMMNLIEIIRGLETSDETLEISLNLAKNLNKETVLCKDSQGFITSRMIGIWASEAERIYEEGLATKEDIDKACKLAFNHPMGPFELCDFSGLDTRLNVCESLEMGFGDRFKPTQTLRNHVLAGRLGRKTGRGYYDYRNKE